VFSFYLFIFFLFLSFSFFFFFSSLSAGRCVEKTSQHAGRPVFYFLFCRPILRRPFRSVGIFIPFRFFLTTEARQTPPPVMAERGWDKADPQSLVRFHKRGAPDGGKEKRKGERKSFSFEGEKPAK
jgi:hypothetical protein